MQGSPPLQVLALAGTEASICKRIAGIKVEAMGGSPMGGGFYLALDAITITLLFSG